MQGARHVITVHCTNRSNIAVPVNDSTAPSAFAALRAALKGDPVLSDAYFVCRSVADRRVVLLTDELGLDLPWEAVPGKGAARVLNVFLQPRIYAAHVSPGMRRSAILFCDVMPRSDVLLQYLSEHELYLKAVLTTPHTLHLEGTGIKVTKALREYQNNQDSVKNLFGQSATLCKFDASFVGCMYVCVHVCMRVSVSVCE